MSVEENHELAANKLLSVKVICSPAAKSRISAAIATLLGASDINPTIAASLKWMIKKPDETGQQKKGAWKFSKGCRHPNVMSNPSQLVSVARFKSAAIIQS